VPLADFAEKTFETAYDIELASGIGGNPAVFAPSQVLEKLLGFDAAANPDANHVLWSVLSASRPPGLVLTSESWAGSGFAAPEQVHLPTFPISYVVQFKRPEYLRGSRAAQWRLWHAPYYRFRRETDQQRVLKRLELNLGSEAVVRYAAPAFHTNPQLDAARWARTIISQTGHVSPTTLADHQVWTYQAADQPGRGNPAGPLRSFETFGTIFRSPEAISGETSRDLMRGDGLAAHVRALGQVAMLREPHLRRVVGAWDVSLREADVGAGYRANVTSFAAFMTLLTWLGARWWLLDRAALR